MIYRTDPFGRFTFVNPVATRILGYTEAELLAMKYFELIRPELEIAETAYPFAATWCKNRRVSFDEQRLFEHFRKAGLMQFPSPWINPTTSKLARSCSPVG